MTSHDMYVFYIYILFCMHICIVQHIDLDFNALYNKLILLLLLLLLISYRSLLSREFWPAHALPSGAVSERDKADNLQVLPPRLLLSPQYILANLMPSRTLLPGAAGRPSHQPLPRGYIQQRDREI